VGVARYVPHSEYAKLDRTKREDNAETQRYAEERGVRRGEERRIEEIRNRIAGRRLRA
jgi:hypothetical protein